MTRAVVDASAITEYLVGTGIGVRVSRRLIRSANDLHVPHLCTIEVASALRGLVLGRKVPEVKARSALEDLSGLRAKRHPAEPYLPRMWELRQNLTTYDAAYVALAEALDATLVTSDPKLAPKYRHYADVEVIA